MDIQIKHLHLNLKIVASFPSVRILFVHIVHTFSKVKESRQQKKYQTKPKKKPKFDPATRTRATVTIPYIQGVTENVQRILRKHQITTAVKPRSKLRNFLVHPKDKPPLDTTAGIVYEIPCRTCE